MWNSRTVLDLPLGNQRTLLASATSLGTDAPRPRIQVAHQGPQAANYIHIGDAATSQSMTAQKAYSAGMAVAAPPDGGRGIYSVVGSFHVAANDCIPHIFAGRFATSANLSTLATTGHLLSVHQPIQMGQDDGSVSIDRLVSLQFDDVAYHPFIVFGVSVTCYASRNGVRLYGSLAVRALSARDLLPYEDPRID